MPHEGDIGTVFRRYPEPWKVFIEDADLQVRTISARCNSKLYHELDRVRVVMPACGPYQLQIACSSTGPLQAGSRAGSAARRRGAGHHYSGVQQIWLANVHASCRWRAVLRLALLDVGALYCRMRWEQTRQMTRAARAWGSRWFGPSTRCSALPSR